MRRLLAVSAVVLLGLCGQAQAHPRRHVSQSACPAGVPVQTVTVVNQADARPSALAKVENAVVAQSLQLRAAWGTPCVQFGPGGWRLYLKGQSVDAHFFYGVPYALVATEGMVYNAWSERFSHEVVEMLVNPTTGRAYYDPSRGVSGSDFGPVEAADPVDERGYTLDGVYVSDFVTPAYFAGAASVPATGCNPAGALPCGAPIASADAPGPYDAMGILTAAWQTTWEQNDN